MTRDMRVRQSVRWADLSAVFLLVTCTTLPGGCSLLQAPDHCEGVAKLPPARMSANSVGLEITTISFHLRDAEAAEEIFSELDEQVMPVDVRRRLSENGFRVGVLGTQLPPAVHALLRLAEERRQRPTADSVREGLDLQRFLQCRANEPYPINLNSVVDHLQVPYFDGEITALESFDDAVCGMALRCRPDGSKAAAITLVPKIDHGQLRQKFVVENGAFHMAAGRDVRAYDELAATITLNAGETLLMTSLAVEHQMGRTFFVNSAAQRQRMLLVRLAQTQPKPLFSQQLDAPLTSTED